MSDQKDQTKPDLWQQTDEDNHTLRIDISLGVWASALVTRMHTTPESWLAHVMCPGGSHAGLSHGCEDPLNEARRWCEATILKDATRAVEDWAKIFFAISGGDDGVQALAAELREVTFSAKLIEQIRDIAVKAKAAQDEVCDE